MHKDDEIIRLNPEIAKASTDIVNKNRTIMSADATVAIVDKIKKEFEIKQVEANNKASNASDSEIKQIFEQIGAMYQISARVIEYLTQSLGSPESKKKIEAMREMRYMKAPTKAPITPAGAPLPKPPSGGGGQGATPTQH